MTEPMIDDMVKGYRDGRDPSSPEPSGNRSASYRHGFMNGRDDLRQRPRALAWEIRRMAVDAVREDWP